MYAQNDFYSYPRPVRSNSAANVALAGMVIVAVLAIIATILVAIYKIKVDIDYPFNSIFSSRKYAIQAAETKLNAHFNNKLSKFQSLADTCTQSTQIQVGYWRLKFEFNLHCDADGDDDIVDDAVEEFCDNNDDNDNNNIQEPINGMSCDADMELKKCSVECQISWEKLFDNAADDRTGAAGTDVQCLKDLIRAGEAFTILTCVFAGLSFLIVLAYRFGQRFASWIIVAVFILLTSIFAALAVIMGSAVIHKDCDGKNSSIHALGKDIESSFDENLDGIDTSTHYDASFILFIIAAALSFLIMIIFIVLHKSYQRKAGVGKTYNYPPVTYAAPPPPAPYQPPVNYVQHQPYTYSHPAPWYNDYGGSQVSYTQDYYY